MALGKLQRNNQPTKTEQERHEETLRHVRDHAIFEQIVASVLAGAASAGGIALIARSLFLLSAGRGVLGALGQSVIGAILTAMICFFIGFVLSVVVILPLYRYLTENHRPKRGLLPVAMPLLAVLGLAGAHLWPGVFGFSWITYLAVFGGAAYAALALKRRMRPLLLAEAAQNQPGIPRIH